MEKLIDILKFSEEYLKKYSFSKSRLQAEKVVAHVLRLERISLYTYFDRKLTENEKIEIKKFLREMSRGKSDFETTLKKVENKSSVEIVQEIENYREENLKFFSQCVEYLKKQNIENPKLETEYIFSHVLKSNRLTLTLNFTRKITDGEKEILKNMLMERAKKRRPLQYILGEEEFFGYKFKVDERVLIPRSETELLVEQCINLMYGVKSPIILDIGIGSGAIAITLGKELPHAKILGVDISEGALEVANINKELNEASNVKFIKSNVFENIKFKDFDIIVSNPPYIPEKQYADLMPEVKQHEPKLALTAEKDGYYFYELIGKESVKYLKSGGYLAFETGYNQAQRVKELMEENNFQNVIVVRDYHQIERIVVGRKL